MYSVFKLGVHVLFSIASSTINETNFNPDIIDTSPLLTRMRFLELQIALVILI